jgi:hypothetical protein
MGNKRERQLRRASDTFSRPVPRDSLLNLTPHREEHVGQDRAWNQNTEHLEAGAQKEEALPREEIARHGELAEQAIRAAYDKGERPKGFQSQVYLPGDCH